jgi:hypothetical protein
MSSFQQNQGAESPVTASALGLESSGVMFMQISLRLISIAIRSLLILAWGLAVQVEQGMVLR